MAEIKKWRVKYDHHDGRAGVVEVTTEIKKCEDAVIRYGNGKYGMLRGAGDCKIGRIYDLRYNKGDLHMVMLKSYFGAGMIEAVEITAG